jgi:hypothetical protein
MVRADHGPQSLLDERGQNSEALGDERGRLDDKARTGIAEHGTAWLCLDGKVPPENLFPRVWARPLPVFNSKAWLGELKFGLHSRLVGCLVSDPGLRAWFSASETVAGVRTGATSPGARDGHIWRGQKTWLIGNSGDLRQGPPGRDRCGFPHPSRCLKVGTETRAMLELEFSVRPILNIHPALRVGYSARNLDLPHLMCPSWSAPQDLPRLAPARIGRNGWWVAI